MHSDPVYKLRLHEEHVTHGAYTIYRVPGGLIYTIIRIVSAEMGSKIERKMNSVFVPVPDSFFQE
jgi:hypothetical protein